MDKIKNKITHKEITCVFCCETIYRPAYDIGNVTYTMCYDCCMNWLSIFREILIKKNIIKEEKHCGNGTNQ